MNERTDIACAVLHTDKDGNTVPCPGYPHAPAAAPEPDATEPDEGHPEPPTEDELNTALPVRPDPRQPAYDAVYEYIRALGDYQPPDTVHRNAVIWRAVHAALGATPVGRCISSHCVEGDHMVPVEERAPTIAQVALATWPRGIRPFAYSAVTDEQDTGLRCPRCDCADRLPQCDHCKTCPHARQKPKEKSA